MSRIRKAEVESSYNLAEAWLGEIMIWPQAPCYRVVGGWIDFEPGSNLNSFPPPSPFADGDLVLSFARLGARGEPSKKSIEKWASKYGLLRRKDTQLPGNQLLKDGRVNQEPMIVSEFVREVFRVRDLLSLYTQMRDRNYFAVMSRAREPGTATDRHLADYVMPVLTDEYPERDRVLAHWEAMDSLAPLHAIARTDQFLADKLSASLARVHLRVVPGFQLPREFHEGDRKAAMRRANLHYRPSYSWHCPDLLSAIYLQLSLLVTRSTPMRFCEACGTALPAKPKHKRFCNDTCRSNARYHR